MGAFWLCLGLAFAPQLERLAERGPLGVAVGWLTRRSLTVYLWHAVAIVVAYRSLAALSFRFAPGPWPRGLFALATAILVFGVTSALAVAVGWLEDVAGRRKATWWPQADPRMGGSERQLEPAPRLAWLRRPLFAVVAASLLTAVLGFVAAPTAASSDVARVLPRTPSRAPVLPLPGAGSLPPRSDTGEGEPPAAAGPRRVARAEDSALYTASSGDQVEPTDLQRSLAPPAPAELADLLSAEVVHWMAKTETAGVEILVLRPGALQWRAAFGIDPLDDQPLTSGRRFDSNSITKTFTAALVYRLVEDGRLELDEPVPALRAIPAFPAGEFTVRQLLNHRSGLVGYRDTPEFASASGIRTPQEALLASLDAPRLGDPGENVNYSSSNYLVLGFLLEQVTGRSYDDLLRKELLEPLRLNDSSHNPPAVGWPNFATGGLVTTVDDLARWLAALLRDGAVIDRASLAEATVIDRTTGIGAGIWGYCPCDGSQTGAERFVGLGHSGGTTQMQYSPTDDLIIVADLTSAIPELGDGSDALSPLFQRLRDIVADNE